MSYFEIFALSYFFTATDTSKMWEADIVSTVSGLSGNNYLISRNKYLGSMKISLNNHLRGIDTNSFKPEFWLF